MPFKIWITPIYSYGPFVDATSFAGVCNGSLIITIYSTYSGGLSVGQYYYTNSSLTTPLNYEYASLDASSGYTINTSTGQATAFYTIC